MVFVQILAIQQQTSAKQFKERLSYLIQNQLEVKVRTTPTGKRQHLKFTESIELV